MTVRVAINGFGRIGRLILRAIVESGRKDIEVVAINDLGPVETNAHLIRHDSVHGRFPHEVKVTGDTIDVGRGPIKVTAIKDPALLPHKELRVDIALECTGIFTSKEKAVAHLKAGARRVLVSAPSDGADLTVVYGVNDDKLSKDHTVVSNASCTTNCLAPVVAILQKVVGIEHGFMTTIHSYTGDQPNFDTLHKDLYRARAAALNIIPTTTGAAKAVGLVIPELNGKLDGASMRVPTPNVSLVDFKFVASRATTVDEINNAVIDASKSNRLTGILNYTREKLVSSDLNHDPASATVAIDQTKVIGGTFARVVAWYDNEWGFSNRMADTAVAMGRLGVTGERPMSPFRTLDDAPDLRGKRVLIRVDLNVPMAPDDKGRGKVSDDTRIRASAPTIREVTGKGGKAILVAHFGRPKDGPDPQFSLKQVVPAVAAVLGQPVAFAGNCMGPEAEAAVAALPPGGVLVLENTRFHKGEEKNDPLFTAALAKLGDLFVNDAFSAAHRAHASTVGLANHLPAFAGRGMQAELAALESVLGDPKRPVVAIIGGAKISSKIDVLENLARKVDALVIGGGMANTFLLAQGVAVGKSLAEPDLADTARRIMAAAAKAGSTILLPVDAAVAAEFKAGAPSTTVAIAAVPADKMILDLGPKSVAAVNGWIDKAATLVWNGPLGAFEVPPFDRATVEAARHAAERTRAGKLLSVAGGGDTVAALNHAGVADGFSFVSTAGGAFLEWMEGKALPGVEVLRRRG